VEIFKLRCIHCGTEFPVYPSKSNCEKCGGTLEFKANLPEPGKLGFSGHLGEITISRNLSKSFSSTINTSIPMHDPDSSDKASFLLELYRKGLNLPEKELYEYFLNHAVETTKSTIGFFHLVSDDQESIILTSWNRKALKNCTADYNTHYPVEQAGNWADSVRLKRPIIYNDFGKSPNQKGVPEGHVAIKRMLSFPIMEDGKAKAIFGVGNKEDPYVKDDVIQLELVANELNKILKQRKIETELREAKEKYHSLFANMLDGFAYCEMILDAEGKPVDFVYLEINDAFERLTGLRRENVVGRKVSEAIPGTREGNPEIFDIYGRVAKTGNPERFELFFKPLNVWLYISVYSPSRGYFAAVFENITERKLLQQRLEEKAAELEEYATRMEELAEERALKLKDAERMAAIGQTAGMVGHDIRNPLQAITSDVFLLKSDLSVVPEGEEKEGMKESLDGIEKSVEYINKIVQDLQDYAKPLKPAMQETRLDELCEECTLKKEIPESVEASCEVAEDAKKLAADSAMLKRILSNLVSNAVQAMPNGGKIFVRAYRDSGDTVITVHDTGMGIPEEARPRLFTPLFTTKSKGQGFGLAVVKRMTEALGGTVTFESPNNEGTTFIVRLPPSKK